MTNREKIEAVRNVQNYTVEIGELLKQIIHDTSEDYIQGIDNFIIDCNSITVYYHWYCRGETTYDEAVIPIAWLDEGFDYKSAYQDKVRLAQEKAKKEAEAKRKREEKRKAENEYKQYLELKMKYEGIKEMEEAPCS